MPLALPLPHYQALIPQIRSASGAASSGMVFSVLPLLLQSQQSDFDDWISLITLCLAPLIAHLAAGVPQPSYLTSTHPRWHDRICHYMPTSIVWRYAAITDRRIRSLKWDAASIAAANALFWTPRGWDGSEDMAARSLEFCTYLPETSRVEVLSWDMAKTLIITLQGIQAIYVLGNNFSEDSRMPISATLDIVFSPLAVLGLYRLCAALWLTEHFAFTSRSTSQRLDAPRRFSVDSLLEESGKPSTTVQDFRGTAYIPSRVFRSLFFVLMLVLWAMLLFYTFGSETPDMVNFSFLICIILYHLILAPSLMLIGYYFCKGLTTTTIIPCISATWYKIYSMTVMILMVFLIVVSGVETRKTPCGVWSITGGFDGDYWACKSRASDFIRIDPQVGGSAFGIASTYPNSTASVNLGTGQFWVDNFTGSCIGSWSSEQRLHGVTLGNVQSDGLVWPGP